MTEEEKRRIEELAAKAGQRYQTGSGRDLPNQPDPSLVDSPFAHADLNIHNDLSEPEKNRYVAALKKAALPLAMMGVAAALASKDGQAPEAAVAALGAYIRGADAVAQRARAQALEKQKLQMDYMTQTLPFQKPQGQINTLNAGARMVGLDPNQMQYQDQRSAEAQRLKDQRTAQSNAVAMDLGSKLLTDTDPRRQRYGIQILRKTADSPAFNQALDLIESDLISGKGLTDATKALAQAMNRNDPEAVAAMLDILPQDMKDDAVRYVSGISTAKVTSAMGEARMKGMVDYRAAADLEKNPTPIIVHMLRGAAAGIPIDPRDAAVADVYLKKDKTDYNAANREAVAEVVRLKNVKQWIPEMELMPGDYQNWLDIRAGKDVEVQKKIASRIYAGYISENPEIRKMISQSQAPQDANRGVAPDENLGAW